MEVEVFYTKEFKKDVKKIKNKATQERIKKLILKIINNPRIGKPLSYELRGLRSIRLHPFRIIYEIKKNKIILLKFEHRKRIYKTF